ncbi:MAG: hypothetical protein CVU05_03290 [Bacteroidetes bacterium HGW-Bacteroidetes-21]|jgi:MoaA/NifB/PqqE/SkfB family radical SAM enzyme|nr:MAG: hypothetical protein CVU05_03290 [Bacteroidetes bacterium HGW-Bacteroidetes-21]
MIFGKSEYKSEKRNSIKAFNKIRGRSKTKYFCHAPFHSLVFSPYGNILACFYNKREFLGTYPKDSMHDVWFGEKIKKLRQHIQHNDLTFGCDDCRRQLRQENYFSVGAWRYDYLAGKEQEYPDSFDFQMSNKCNLQCIMCNGELSDQVRMNKEMCDPYENPYDDAFLEQLKVFIPHLKEASFTGGETFMNPVYFKIWDLFIELNPGIKVSITSNCTILNDKIKTYLSKLKFNITVSIDAVEENIYKQIRQGAHLQKTLENFEYYLNYTRQIGTTFNVKVCPMQQNIYHLPDLLKFFNAKNVTVIFNNVVFPPSCSLWNLSSQKLDEIKTFLSKNRGSGENVIENENWQRYDNLINQVVNWHKESVLRENNLSLFNGTSEELLNTLVTSTNKYIEEVYYYDDQEKLVKQQYYSEKIRQIFNAIEEDHVRIKSLFYFLNLPLERFVGEIEFRDVDKLISRAKQAANNDKDITWKEIQ